MGKVGTSMVVFTTLSGLLWGGWLIGSQTPEGQEALAKAYQDFRENKAAQYDQDFFAENAMRVFVCGDGGLLDTTPNKPCLAVAAGGKLFIIDAGSGAAAALERVGMPLNRLHAVLLTGADPVRAGDLDEMWALASAQRQNRTLPVYGPVDAHRLVFGLNEAMGATAGVNGLEPWAPAPAPGQPVVVYKDDQLEVLAYTTDQDAFSGRVGYVFNYRGRILTIAPNGSAAWAAAAPGQTDVMLQTNFSEQFAQLHNPDTGNMMAGLQQFAQAANDADAKTLVLANAGENPIVNEMSKRVARDAGMANVVTSGAGVVLELPLENRDVNVRRL
jgi:ribonuclease Z